jgi:hypothetical protein
VWRNNKTPHNSEIVGVVKHEEQRNTRKNYEIGGATKHKKEQCNEAWGGATSKHRQEQ